MITTLKTHMEQSQKYISEFLKIENLNKFGEEAFQGLIEYGKKTRRKTCFTSNT